MVPIASPFYVLCTFPEIPRMARGDLIHRKDSKGLNSTLSSGASGLQALVKLLTNKSYSRMDGAKSLLQLCWEIMIPSESTSFCDMPPDLPDISQHKNTLAELTQTCRFLSSSHLVSASDGCALQAEPGFAGSSPSPRPPSAPDNFILIAQILSLDFISCPAAPVIARIPDALPAAHISERALSAFSGPSSEGKQPSSSMHKQLGSCGWN